jgi:hypothetical protein
LSKKKAVTMKKNKKIDPNSLKKIKGGFLDPHRVVIAYNEQKKASDLLNKV